MSIDYYVAKWDEEANKVYTCVRGKSETELACKLGKGKSIAYTIDDVHITSPNGDRGVFDGLNTIKWSHGRVWSKQCTVYTFRISAEYYQQAYLSDYSYR